MTTDPQGRMTAMPTISPVTREQLDGTAEYLEKMAAKLRAADPKQVYSIDVNNVVTFADDPDAPGGRVIADECTARVEWMEEASRG